VIYAAAALVLGAGALWLSWRFPTALLLLALAALAIRPQIWYGAPDVGVGWSLHHTLLLVALLVNGAKHGVRRTVNWPVLALAAVFGLNLAFSDLDTKVTPILMVSAFGVLALPWTFTQVVPAPGSRRILAVTIASLPLLSVMIDTVFASMGSHPFRVQGATGNAAVFALLAFTGFVVALHESTRRGRPLAGVLAAINLALVVLSGTRMAILASGLFLVIYVFMSPALREQWRKRRIEVAVGAALVLAAAAYYLPTLTWRLFDPRGDGIRLSARDELWPFYYEQFQQSPVFGRGLGAGFVGALHWLNVGVPAPHNEYLHLLVVGGGVGAAACFAAIFLWFRQLWQAVPGHDRTFLAAILPALAAYAVIDNVLIYVTGLALFVYFGVLLTRAAPGQGGDPGGKRRRSSRSAKRRREGAEEEARHPADA
jgi:O-antigen ligase